MTGNDELILVFIKEGFTFLSPAFAKKREKSNFFLNTSSRLFVSKWKYEADSIRRLHKGCEMQKEIFATLLSPTQNKGATYMRVVSALVSFSLPISFTLTFGHFFLSPFFFSSDIEKEKYDREMLFSFGPSWQQKFLSYKLEKKNGL